MLRNFFSWSRKIYFIALLLGFGLLSLQGEGSRELKAEMRIEVPIEESLHQNSANPFLPITGEAPKVVRPVNWQVARALALQQFQARSFEVQITGQENADLEQDCKVLVERTLAALPEIVSAPLIRLKLSLDPLQPRGLASSKTITLGCAGLAEAELVAVLVHELGHILDLGGLVGNSLEVSEFHDGGIVFREDDESLDFYRLSWQTEKKRHFRSSRQDFVSGYAMKDAFEDFAESFTFYVLHGADFRFLAQESTILEQKYAFLRERIFDGQEFSSLQLAEAGSRVWDTTLIAFDQAEFFKRAQQLLASND